MGLPDNKPSLSSSNQSNAPKPSETNPSARININAMKSVMTEDARLSRMASNSIAILDYQTDAGFDQMATVWRSYVSEARQINMKECPKEFVKAYQRNLAANESLADVISEHPHFSGTLEQAVVYDTSKYQEGLVAWRQRLDNQSRKTKVTWDDVETIINNYSIGKPITVTPDIQNKIGLPVITGLRSTYVNGFFSDTARFINNSGRDLTGVLVAIEMTNKAGGMRRVYGEYYWPLWKDGETIEVGISYGQSIIDVKSVALSGDCDQGIIGHGPVHR